MNRVIARGRCPRSNPAAEPPARHAGSRSLAMTCFCALLLTACSSPEAHRTRGDGPGADVRNWGQPVEFHAGAHPYYRTPCVTEPVECNGPPPVFGPTPPPD
jgi:hypothetical protein